MKSKSIRFFTLVAAIALLIASTALSAVSGVAHLIITKEVNSSRPLPRSYLRAPSLR